MRPVQRRLLRASRAARVHLGVTVALGLASAALVVAQAALLADVLASAFLGGSGLAELRGELIALGAVIVARAAVLAGFEVSGRTGAVRAMSELRRALVEHVLVKRPGGLQDERTGELAATAVHGVEALETYFARYLPQVVLGALVPPAILLYLLRVDLVAAAILAATVPLIPVFMVLIGRQAEALARARRRTLAMLSAHFLDVVRGLATLRANAREAAQQGTIADAGDAFRRATMATLRVAFLSALVLELSAMLGTALVAAAVGVQLVAGSLTLTAGLTVLLLAPELYAPLREVGRQFHAGADGMAAAERIFDVLETPAAVRAPHAARLEPGPAMAIQARHAARPAPGPAMAAVQARHAATPAPDPARAAVALERVSFAYTQRPGAVLREASLVLEPGERLALVGPSGAGKSTVAALLLRLADPDRGRVSCGAVDLREVCPRAWRSRVAWVRQRPLIVAGTIADNLRLGAPDASGDELCEAAAAADVLEVVDALPDGFDTRVGDGGRALSAGEAQRIALARALLRNASLVILDEPTANLDEASAAAVGDAIERATRGRTTLVIAHDPAVAAWADRVVALADGRIATQPALEAAV